MDDRAEYLTAHAVFHESRSRARHAVLRQFGHHGAGRRAPRRAGKTREQLRARRAGAASTLFRLFGGDKLPDQRLGAQVRIGHGHSAEHASLYAEGRRVNFRGHAVAENFDKYQRLRSHPGADSLAQYLDSVETAAPAIITLVLPSHGLPFVGIHNRVAAQHTMRSGLRVLEDAVRNRAAACDLLATLFRANSTPW